MILLIDDDPGLSEVIELLLTREGHEVKRVATVKGGLESVRDARIELVITDLKLPDGTGLNVVAAVRASHPALPIIMITSYSSIESAIGALRAGAFDYVIKPFDNDELLHAVDRALAEGRARKQNAQRGGRPLAIEEYIRDVVERFQDTHSETQLARMLGIGRKALWMRRRQWGLKRSSKTDA
ncbi:MAG: response regulator [Bacillota bacterium]